MDPKNTFYTGHPKFYVALDCIIFGFDGEELRLLIHKRKFEPFKGHWSLFGGFMKEEESLDDAANRILYELTGLRHIYMEELRTFGNIARDPAGRVISVAYYALIPAHRYSEDYSKPYSAAWFNLRELPPLIMDHDEMVRQGLDQLRREASSRPLGFELLPVEFTLPQLQALYEAIFQSSLDKRNFRKKILSMDILVKLDEKDKSGSRKGAYLYRFDRNKYLKRVEAGYQFAI